MYPRTYTSLDTYPLDIYPLGHIPLDIYPQDIYPRTYTPHNLKCLIWFMHHVLITYYTLKNIYFAGIEFICNVDAVKLLQICCEEGFSPYNCSGSR